MDIFTTNGAGLFFCKEAKSARNKKMQTLVTEASASVARRRILIRLISAMCLLNKSKKQNDKKTTANDYVSNGCSVNGLSFMF